MEDGLGNPDQDAGGECGEDKRTRGEGHQHRDYLRAHGRPKRDYFFPL
jgi:hypothetical protein